MQKQFLELELQEPTSILGDFETGLLSLVNCFIDKLKLKYMVGSGMAWTLVLENIFLPGYALTWLENSPYMIKVKFEFPQEEEKLVLWHPALISREVYKQTKGNSKPANSDLVLGA